MHEPVRRNSRAEQARINGAKSKGPTSAEGKLRSSRNATTHGLTAALQSTAEVLDPEAFAEILATWTDSFKPQTDAERVLVFLIAAAAFQQDRVVALQTTVLDREFAKRTPALLAVNPDLSTATLYSVAFRDALGDSTELDLLHRYEKTIENSFYRNLKLLMDLQAFRTSPQKTSRTKRTQQSFTLLFEKVCRTVSQKPVFQNEPNDPVPLRVRSAAAA